MAIFCTAKDGCSIWEMEKRLGLGKVGRSRVTPLFAAAYDTVEQKTHGQWGS